MRCFLLAFLFVFSCNSQVEKKPSVDINIRNVYVDYGVQAFSEIQKENDSIIKRFKECISSKNYSDYDKFWNRNDTSIFKYPYDDLYHVVNANYPSYEPTILAIQKLEPNKYLLKIGVMGSPEGFNSLDFIYNIYALRNPQSEFVFKNTIEDNLMNWNRKTVHNITYYYSPDRTLNNDEIQNQIDFENYLTDFLEVDKIDYKYVICNSVHEFSKILGYDYVNDMFFTEQSGGINYSEQALFFSGNDKASYPHEIAHIYLREKFPKIHPVLSEGFATYVGGSKELDYQEHIKILYNYLSENEISISEYLFDDFKRYTIINANSSIMYSCGALLCDLAFKKQAKKGLFDLLKSGDSDDELKKTIEVVFDIKMENFDDFINEELKNYNFSE
jgi:hypothetical protein